MERRRQIGRGTCDGEPDEWWAVGPAGERLDQSRYLHAMGHTQIHNVDNGEAFHSIHNGGIGRREAEAVPDT